LHPHPKSQLQNSYPWPVICQRVVAVVTTKHLLYWDGVTDRASQIENITRRFQAVNPQDPQDAASSQR